MTNTYLQPDDLNRLLAEKFVLIDKLEAKLKDLEERLHFEMEANDRLNDLNVELKGRLREVGQEMKVRIHPSSLKRLEKLNQEKQQKINQLRETIDMALKLIPEDRVRLPYISTIKQVYQSVL